MINNAYINFSDKLIGRFLKGMEKKWLSNESHIVKKEGATRIVYPLAGVGSVLTGAIDTIIGLGASLGAVATAGRYARVNLHMVNHLNSTKRIVARPYKLALKTLNPHAKFKEARISAIGDGVITQFAKEKLGKWIDACNKSDSGFNRQVTSRLTIGLQATATVVTRIVDTIISLPAAALALVTLGKFASINNLAVRGLQITGLATDLLENTVKLLNPKADLRMGCYDSLSHTIKYHKH